MITGEPCEDKIENTEQAKTETPKQQTKKNEDSIVLFELKSSKTDIVEFINDYVCEVATSCIGKKDVGKTMSSISKFFESSLLENLVDDDKLYALDDYREALKPKNGEQDCFYYIKIKKVGYTIRKDRYSISLYKVFFRVPGLDCLLDKLNKIEQVDHRERVHSEGSPALPERVHSEGDNRRQQRPDTGLTQDVVKSIRHQTE